MKWTHFCSYVLWKASINYHIIFQLFFQAWNGMILRKSVTFSEKKIRQKNCDWNSWKIVHIIDCFKNILQNNVRIFEKWLKNKYTKFETEHYLYFCNCKTYIYFKRTLILQFRENSYVKENHMWQHLKGYINIGYIMNR